MTLPWLAPGAPIDWTALEELVAAVVGTEQLAATPQDAGYHAEGDVWTHTRMAIEALVSGPLYAALDRDGQVIVLAGTLLHDAGKPATTRQDPLSAKWTSRGHSARGDNLVRVALWRLGVPFGVREHVCALVRYHQVPFFGITKPAAESAQLALKLSLVTRTDWLVAVADADARGRRCADPADQTRIVDHCALWAEHCRELAVLDRPFAFPTPHTARVWFESAPGARHPSTPAHDDTTCDAILLSGLPASGKDTWLAHQDLPVISLDDLRAELEVDPAGDQAHVIAAAREQARVYLRAGTSFAWNASNLSPPLRSQLLELFRGYRARTRIVYVETTAEEQHARNRARPDPVPAAAIGRMLDRWTVPDPSEAHEVTHLVPSGAGPPWPPVGKS